MSKKSTALILGGLAALGALFYFSKSGTQAAGGGNGGSGGGDSWAGGLSSMAVMEGNTELFGLESPANEGVTEPWQPYEGIISPTDPYNGFALSGTGGGYTERFIKGMAGRPALDVNEQGLLVNRETGKVYPIDPVSGRQVYKLDEQGNISGGGYIANKAGIPYGTQERGPATPVLEYAGKTIYSQPVNYLGIGRSGTEYVGVNPSTGKTYSIPSNIWRPQ